MEIACADFVDIGSTQSFATGVDEKHIEADGGRDLLICWYCLNHQTRMSLTFVYLDSLAVKRIHVLSIVVAEQIPLKLHSI